MKTYITIIIINLIFCSKVCAQKNWFNFESPATQQVQGVMGGYHELRKMTENRDVQSTLGGFFIFGTGSLYSQSKMQSTITFAWQDNDGSFIVSTVPLEKIRIRFDEFAKTPYVAFHIASGMGAYRRDDANSILEHYVDWVFLYCKSSDWQPDIKLPLNDKKIDSSHIEQEEHVYIDVLFGDDKIFVDERSKSLATQLDIPFSFSYSDYFIFRQKIESKKIRFKPIIK